MVFSGIPPTLLLLCKVTNFSIFLDSYLLRIELYRSKQFYLGISVLKGVEKST